MCVVSFFRSLLLDLLICNVTVWHLLTFAVSFTALDEFWKCYENGDPFEAKNVSMDWKKQIRFHWACSWTVCVKCKIVQTIWQDDRKLQY